MICQCSQSHEAVIDLTRAQDRGFDFPGAELFSSHFQTPDESTLSPELNYSAASYECTSCGQKWYVESTPEQYPSIVFAMKYCSDVPPTDNEVHSRKQFLAILAHAGFSKDLCRCSGCKNFKLTGRELCHMHLTLT